MRASGWFQRVAVFTFAALFAAVSTQGALSPEVLEALSGQYVTNGLVAHWDGILNSTNENGEAVHDGDATAWVDLCKGYAFTGFSKIAVENDHLSFNAGNATLDATAAQSIVSRCASGTMQLCIAPTASSCWVFQTAAYAGKNLYPISFWRNGNGYLLATVMRQGSASISTVKCDWLNATNTYTVIYNGVDTANSNPRMVVQKIYANEESQVLTSVTDSTKIKDYNYAKLGNGSYKGGMYALRFYSRKLTDLDVLVNRVLDDVRFLGADPTALVLPDGMRWNAESQRFEFRVTVRCSSGENIVSLDGGQTWGADETRWFPLNDCPTIRIKKSASGKCVCWGGVPAGMVANETGDAFSFLLVQPENVVLDVFTPTHVWKGGDGTFSSAGNWLDADGNAATAAPTAESDVYIPSSDDAAQTVTASAKFSVRSLRLGSGFGKTVTLKVSHLNTNEIAGDFRVCRGGVLTTEYQSTNGGTDTSVRYKLNLTVGGDFVLDGGGTINLTGRGYHRGGSGLSPGTDQPQSDGSSGGKYTSGHAGTLNPYYLPLLAYGSAVQPTSFGTGNNFGKTRGGGAMHLAVARSCRIDGAIASGAETAPGGGGQYNGAGGSIWIECGALTGQGSISANGGSGSSGGRISIAETNVVRGASAFAGRISAYGGSGSPGSKVFRYKGEGEDETQLVTDNENQGSVGVMIMKDSLAAATFAFVTNAPGTRLYVYPGETVRVSKAFDNAGILQLGEGASIRGPDKDHPVTVCSSGSIKLDGDATLDDLCMCASGASITLGEHKLFVRTTAHYKRRGWAAGVNVTCTTNSETGAYGEIVWKKPGFAVIIR